MNRIARVAVCVFVCALAASFARAESAAGFRKIKTADGTIGVWYPTNAAAKKTPLGPFDAEHAEDAAPSGENLPLVVLSHGNGGYYRNYHLLGAHLAKNGFVAAAPQHLDPQNAKPDMHKRVADIKGAIRALQNDALLAPLLDAENISAIGYSLGGATALAAAGASVNWESFLLHCARNRDKDENACGDFPFWIRWMLRAKHAFLSNPKIQFWDFSDNPVAFRKIALVAPVGQPMDAETLAKIPAEVLLLQIDGDEVLRAPFHSEHLRDNLPPQRTTYELIRGAAHYAFVPPFSGRVPKAEIPPELTDPPGFDRLAFIAKMNEKILAFLRG